MAKKAREAFRTISEVADWLDVPAHVLRFWESKFPQIKPVKRAGGRRYYRPNDMLLIGGIKALLHDDGMTIRGVQKMLKEEGIKHISSFSQDIDAPADVDAAKRRSVEREHRREMGESARRGKPSRAVQDKQAIEDAEIAEEPAEPGIERQLAEVAQVANIEAAEQFSAEQPDDDVQERTSPEPSEITQIDTGKDAVEETAEHMPETPQDNAETAQPSEDDAESLEEDSSEEEEDEPENVTSDLFYVDLANNVVPLTPSPMAGRTDVAAKEGSAEDASPEPADTEPAETEPAETAPAEEQLANGADVATKANGNQYSKPMQIEADLGTDAPPPAADPVPADPQDSDITLSEAQIKHLEGMAALRAVPREENELKDSDLLGLRKRLLELRDRVAKELS